MNMRVGLMNLGDAPRVFHNKIHRAVVVPAGRVVTADLDARTIEGLKFSSTPETVLVCEPDQKIPHEMQMIVELLEVIEHESLANAVVRFHEVAPPSNFGDVHPSKAQMQRVLRHMVEDYIAASYGDDRPAPSKKQIHDDKDPAELERELEKQERDKPPPKHPLQLARDAELAAQDAGYRSRAEQMMVEQEIAEQVAELTGAPASEPARVSAPAPAPARVKHKRNR